DMLMNKGTVAYTEDHDKNREYYKTSAGRTEMKYVVLINEGSASSSEILAAGIKDNSEGLLIGTQSYGKGIIQSIEQLKDGSAVKLTTMQYFSPSGEVIHGVGISPDIVVELTDDCYSESGELIDDLQLKRAQDILRKQ
ncbi:MAG: S41 family peptidase, partial [Clostridiales bacterium]|nr:S41 family peptidase [Clostridiales bacterium]